MTTYRPGDEVGALENWPLDNPASDYVIRAGAPRTSGRIEAGGPGAPTRYGLWRCTVGAFDCTEQGDELMVVLEGTGRVIDHATGQVTELHPGVSHFIRDGSRVTWEIDAILTKVFFGHKPEGY